MGYWKWAEGGGGVGGGEIVWWFKFIGRNARRVHEIVHINLLGVEVEAVEPKDLADYWGQCRVGRELVAGVEEERELQVANRPCAGVASWGNLAVEQYQGVVDASEFADPVARVEFPYREVESA